MKLNAHPKLDWVRYFADGQLPYPAGQSPYHCKGVPWIGVMKGCIARAGSLDRLLDATTDVALRAFLNTPFMASQWYDLMPMPMTDIMLGKILGVDPRESLRRESHAQAVEDLSGIYRVVMRIATPKMVARQLPVAAAQVYDFVQVVSRVEGPKEVVAVQRRLPEPIAGYLSTIHAIYVEHALTLCGATGFEVSIEDPVVAGERKPFQLLDVPLRVRWA